MQTLQLTNAEQNAKAHAEEIEAAYEAWDFCNDDGTTAGRTLSRDAKRVLRDHQFDGTNYEQTRDAIEQTMRETPLSVDVRSCWTAPSEPFEPGEFQILLSTGGPALRIIGDLSVYNEPIGAHLQHQDWGTRWLDWHACDTDALRWFVSLFYFGE